MNLTLEVRKRGQKFKLWSSFGSPCRGGAAAEVLIAFFVDSSQLVARASLVKKYGRWVMVV